MSEGNMIYLGLCVRYKPPIIGIHYKNKHNDASKKVYSIMLQKLVFNPNAQEVAQQLFLEHPHMLNRSKIPLSTITKLVRKIQQELKINEDSDQYKEEPSNKKKPSPEEILDAKRRQFERKFHNNQFNDDGPLNRSL